MHKSSIRFSAFIMIILLIALICTSVSLASEQGSDEIPMVRGPGVSDDALQAVAEAHGRLVLSDYLDFKRPDEQDRARLGKLVERAQANWLAGSVGSARGLFREISKMALTADWRDAHRESIHYAILRLAQSSPTATERDEWLEKAVSTFPDLRPDPDILPPPLIESFSAVKKRVLALAILYSPYEHFPEHRFLLINGKRFANSPELKVRLPKATYRITALSDLYEPITERLTTSQLQVFRLSMPTIARGTCLTPTATEGLRQVEKITVVYSADCLRTRTSVGWQPRAVDLAEAMRTPTMGELANQQPMKDPFLLDAPEERTALQRKHWLWAGLTAIAIGAAYMIHNEYTLE
jgi:hypothetical protein